MVARLVRDQEVVGSSPVTSTTKKRRVFALRFFVFADANPRPLPFYRAPGNRSEARFSGRGGAERARGRRPAGAARESSRPRRRGFKSRHLDHEKAKGFCPSLFCFCGREPTTSSLLQGSRKSQRSEIFGKRRSGARTRAPPCRGGARKQPTATTRVQVPVTSTTKKRRVLPFAFLYNERPCRRQGRNETKVKKPLTFSVAALPIRRGQERQQECRGRDLSAYR